MLIEQKNMSSKKLRANINIDLRIFIKEEAPLQKSHGTD